MDMPPSGWYPDPYGVPGLLRWWDGSGWTQHTHAGSAEKPSDASGPATSLDATRIGALGTASDAAPRTAIERLLPRPTTIQPAVRPGEATSLQSTTVQPTTMQPPVPGGRPEAVRSGAGWPNSGPPGGYQGAEPPYARGEEPYARGQEEQFGGTQVLPIGDAPWTAPGGPGRHGRPVGLPSWLGSYPAQRRRRMLLGGLLAGGTAVALALVAIVVSNLGSPATTTTASGLTSAASASAPTPQASATPTPSTTGPAGGLSDSVSGLSYALLPAPWTNGCPAGLSSQQTLTWTAGESTQAGQFNNNGTQTTWFGEACSGPLPQQYGYTGVADLEPTAMNLVNQFDGPYYGPLNHQRTPLASTPVSISGHPAWEAKYLETYPNAASMGLPFNSEEAAIVVADQGTGLPPAVFFVSVPSNLNVANVDALVSSLTLTVTSATQPPTPQGGQPTQPGNGNGHGGGDGGGGGVNP